MNAPNLDKLFVEEADKARGARLLLHCCCAPCASACIERLKEYFSVTALFYNPNIEDPEYTKRKGELVRLLSETGWADIRDIDSPSAAFFEAVKGLESEPEGGKRCEACFRLRLSVTARVADEESYDYFCSTLTLSPLKDAAKINEIGESVQGVARWLHSDFKKRDGYKESILLSKEHNLYRQNYCGCVFSKRSTSDDVG